VGLFCVQGARIAEATTIIVVDPLTARLEQAVALGATHAAHPDDLDAVMADVAPDGVDFAFEVVGSCELAEIALQHTRSHGTTVLVGIPPTGQRLDLDPAQLLRREKWLTGTMYGSEDPAVALPMLLDHVRSGALRLEPLLGPSFSLEEVDAAVRASLEGVAGRVIVRP
jgi:Zn-dependent alcohol dehydrogenase